MCAFTETLLESELFGHEMGSFTGASGQRRGVIEMADGGTLFLDELGETSLNVQVNLLRVLEEMCFRRVGGQKTVHVDTRIVAATNANLEMKTQDGSFREDLFYRLNVFPIHLPPLRERPEDITLLVRHFLEDAGNDYGLDAPEISMEAMEAITTYPWPGNVRQLRSLCERWVIVANGRLVTKEMLPPDMQTGQSLRVDKYGTTPLLTIDETVPMKMAVDRAAVQVERYPPSPEKEWRSLDQYGEGRRHHKAHPVYKNETVRTRRDGLSELMFRIALFSLLVLLSCKEKAEVERVPVYLDVGAPMAGVGEVFIDFPMGAPMGGYSNRCDYLGRNGAVDKRRSAYTQAWSSSAGIQTRALAKALWLHNGDQDFVVIKADFIYAFDKMVRDLEDELEEVTGRDRARGITSSHTHNAPANYSDSYHFYLGGDRYNEEVYQRTLGSLTDAAVDAWNEMQPASIGMGIAEDWDPDDLVYADRRGENDDLKVWDDHEPGKKKDPRLWLLRVDTASGEPLGVIFNFGIHGTSLGADNPRSQPMRQVTSNMHWRNALIHPWIAHWQEAAEYLTARHGYALRAHGDHW